MHFPSQSSARAYKPIAAAALTVLLSACGGGNDTTDARASVQSVAALQPAKQIQSVANGVSCPSGAAFDSSLGFCADANNAYGPFTNAMTRSCTAYGGGSTCTTTAPYTVGTATLQLQRWSVSFARSLRGKGSCPTGATPSAAYYNQCVETVSGSANVFAGFPADEVARCKTLGGGNACLSTRWGAPFYRTVAFAHYLQNNLTAAWNGSGLPSVSVTVSTPDQGSVYATTGLAAPTSNPVDATTAQYRWASVTKNYTTAIVMKMQEQGLINIDDKLSRHLSVPGLANGSSITIRELLDHSAGVGDYLDSSQSFLNSTNSWRTYADNDVVGYINEVGPSFAPGGGYSYSNGGFYLLGMLVQAKLGVPLQTAFDQQIVKPLGLAHTFLDVTSGPANKLPELVESSRAYAYSTTSVRGAGALVATTADMAKYMRAVYGGGGFLAAASVAAMESPSANNGGYGLGTILFTADDGTPYYGHTGTLLNYKSLAYYIPSMDTSVALTMNDYPNSTVLNNIEAAVYATVKTQYGH